MNSQPSKTSSTKRGRLDGRDWGLAVVLGAASLALYARTACPSIYVGDSAEIAGAALTFGVPHPPGYPLFTSLTGVLTKLLPGLDAAYRVNLVVGFYGAIAVALLALLVRRLGATRAAACFAAISLATGSTFWSQSVAAEVYSFDALLFFGSLHGLLSVARNPERGRTWIVAGLVFGLWLGHRALNVVFMPSLLWALGAWLGPVSLKKHLRKLLWAALATIVGGVLPLSYLVLSSSGDPFIDIGDPESLDRLWDVVRGTPYARHLGDSSPERSLHRLADFFQGSLNASELGLGFHAALFTLLAAVTRKTAGRGWTFAFASLIAIDLVFASRYSVLDIEVFFMPAWSACAVLSAFGFDRLASHASGRFKTAIAAALILLSGAIALSQNFSKNDLSKHQLTRVFADSIFESLPQNAILFVNGDTSIHCAWYLQAVEGTRPDVTVLSLGHTVPWHLEQLKARSPKIEWPPFDERIAPSQYARALMLANIEARPVCISPAIDATGILKQEGARAFELFTRGLVRQVYYTGQSFDLRDRLAWNLEFFQGIQEQLKELPARPDMDSRSTLLQFSLCLYLSAGRARQAGWVELERESLQASLFYEPDVQELAVHEDVLRGLGIETPLNQFGRQARERLSELPLLSSD